MMLAQVDIATDPWKFVPSTPEVWLLTSFLTIAYIYTVRVIGPKAVAPGESALSRSHVLSFVAAITVLWVSRDWPIHDISDYLYSVHMVQHMALSFWLPPLALLATPVWLMRACSSDRVRRIERCASSLALSSQHCFSMVQHCSPICPHW